LTRLTLSICWPIQRSVCLSTIVNNAGWCLQGWKRQADLLGADRSGVSAWHLSRNRSCPTAARSRNLSHEPACSARPLV
jgi:hypothetical protein